VTTRTVDLKKEGKRARKPAAGYPVNKPAEDPIVTAVAKRAKTLKRHPAQR